MEQRKHTFSREPGWSYSRMNTLRSCLRLYWYEYYAKRFAPEHEKARVTALQQLSRIPFELGNAVHLTVADVLRKLQKDGKLVHRDEALAAALKKFDILIGSKQLVESRLGLFPGQEEIKNLRRQVDACITAFYGSGWLEMLQEAAPGSRKAWHIDPPGYGEFRIGGKKAYAKPDLVFGHDDGKHYIVEWKTGKPHPQQNAVQVQAYLFYAREVMGLPFERAVGVVQYLGAPAEPQLRIEGDNIDPADVKDRILAELRLIESLCEDVADNVPKPLGHFPRTEELGYCELCRYREMCRPDFKKK